jgi:adenylate cyclase
MMRAGTRRRVGLFLRVLAFGVLISAALGTVAGTVFRHWPLFGALSGTINGVALVAVIAGAEIFLPPTRLGYALERAPFLLTFAAKWVVYSAVILLVAGGRLGGRFATAVLLSGDPGQAFDQTKGMPALLAVAVMFLGMLPLVGLLQLGRLLGERTLRDILFGRRHRSRTEERFFLFVDIAGSTPLAERIGPEAVHRFLSEVFRLASDPIDDHHGEVYQYVGDEIVITWTVAEGHDRARPVACFFAIQQALEQAAPDFDREFGAVPRLRAALHAGPVITGEVGGSRRAIVYHGDVMNTASRLEGASRDLERQFLMSAEALQGLDGVEAYALEDLGLQRLRGRAEPVRVYAVTAKPSTNGQKTISAEERLPNHGIQPTAFGRG